MLEDIFNEHFSGTRKPTTVLVVHDGEPASPESVKATLRDAANKVSSGAVHAQNGLVVDCDLWFVEQVWRGQMEILEFFGFFPILSSA